MTGDARFCLSLNKIKEAERMPETKQIKDLVVVDRDSLEKTIFILKPNVSPIYEYENGVKTEKIKGYKVGVLGIDGPCTGMDLILRKKTSIKVSDSLTTVQFKVNMDETKVYANNSGMQISLWVSDISKVRLSGEKS